MRLFLTLSLCVMLIGGTALAQGAAGGDKQTIGQQLIEQATAGPNYIQQDFCNTLESNVTDKFGDDRGQELWQNFQNQEVPQHDVDKMINGDMTSSQLQNLFDCKRSEVEDLEEALDDTVMDKNKKMFFGIMIVVMVGDFDLDPTSEFCKQATGAMDEVEDEDLEKMFKGNVSVKVIMIIFGFESKDDGKFMQDIMNGMQQSPFGDHPMAQSMGMGGQEGFDPSRFPTMTEGMPGFGENEDGMAGGMPFDQKMPPCPFFGGNMEEMLGDHSENEPVSTK